jgi:hypothetical protein
MSDKNTTDSDSDSLQRQSALTATPLSDAACCASSFRLFAADFILRLIEQYPGSSYTSWKSQHGDGETVYSVTVFPNGRDEEGRTHSSPCLCILIDGICKRHVAIPLALYPECPRSGIPQFHVKSSAVSREFHDLSLLVSGWTHLKGIPIPSQATNSEANPESLSPLPHPQAGE